MVPPMMRWVAGAEIEVVFTHWTRRGEAAVDVDGVELRVPGPIPGERGRVRVTGRSRGGPVAWGELIEISESSPHRRPAPCPLEGRCGGCGLQHVADAAQLGLKVRSAPLGSELRDALVPEGDWIRSAPFGWRHKAILLPARVRGRLALGGYARGSHEVVDQPDCAVLAAPLRAAVNGLREALAPLDLPLSPPGSPILDGALRAIVLRGSRSGGVLATIVVTSPDARLRATLKSLVVRGVLSGAFEHVHDAPGDAVIGRGPARLLAGVEQLVEEVADVGLPLLPLAFFQVNPGVLEQIVLRLRDEAQGAERLVDAYSGVGALGLGVAARLEPAPSLAGCDVVESGVAAAVETAAALGIAADYRVGAPAACLSVVASDVVLVDPPRKGCKPADLAALASAGTILYVSCNAASLARDAERLLEQGFRVSALVPADMLPQTHHVEWIARFDR